MKITFLVPRNDLSGHRKLVTMLARELGQRHAVRLLYPVIPDQALTRHRVQPASRLGRAKQFVLDLCRHIAHPRWRYASLMNDGQVTVETYWRTLSAHALESADVVIYSSPYQALELAEIPQGRAARVFYVMHDQSRTDAHLVDPALIRRAYQTGDRIVALSLETRRHLHECGVEAEAVIPAGVDTAIFHPAASQPASRPVKILGYYWPGEPRKGADVLRQALQQLRHRHPAASISLLAPPGVTVDGYPTFSNLSEEGLAGAYRAHDIFVYPNISGGGFGLPPLEAMACGCAVVATRVGAIEDFARHGVSGLLCDPNDVDQLVDSLERLVQDPLLRSTLQANAAQQAREWSWPHAAERLERYVAGLIQQPAWPASLAEEVVQRSAA